MFGAISKGGFDAFFVEFGAVDANIGRMFGTISESFFGARELRKVGIIGIVLVKDDDFGVHFEKNRFVVGVFVSRRVAEGGGNKVGESGNMNGKTVKNVGFEGGGGSGNDGIRRASFPGIAEKLVKNGGFDRFFRGKNGNVFAGNVENLMDKMSYSGFAGGAGNADNFEVASRIAIVRRK